MLPGPTSESQEVILRTAPLGLPDSLFWDTDPGALHPEKHARYIVERVLEYGGLEAWYRMRSFYGDDSLREVVTSLRNLSQKSMRLCCVAFDLQPTDFRCFTAKPFPPAPWIS